MKNSCLGLTELYWECREGHNLWHWTHPRKLHGLSGAWAESWIMGQSCIGSELQRRCSTWKYRGRMKITSQRPEFCGMSHGQTDEIGSCEKKAKAACWDESHDQSFQNAREVAVRSKRMCQSENFHTYGPRQNPDIWLSYLPLVLSATNSSVWCSKEASSEQKNKTLYEYLGWESATLENKNALILVFINRSLMYNWRKTYKFW